MSQRQSEALKDEIARGADAPVPVLPYLFLTAATLALSVSSCVGLRDNDFNQPDVAEVGADAEASIDGSDSSDVRSVTPGDETADGDGDGDAADAEACVSTCSQEGTARCADSVNVEMCTSSSTGCMTWRPVRGCAVGSVCCQGVCRADDTTLPTECVPLVFPPGYDLYVSAIRASAGSDGGAPRQASLERAPDGEDAGADDAASDGRSADVSLSDAADATVDRTEDEGGFDGGTATDPLPTVTQALAVAKQLLPVLGRDVRIYVGRGTYDAEHGEVFPLIVPGGVTIEGAGPGRSVIAGTGYFNTATRGQTFYQPDFFSSLVLGDTQRLTRVAGFTITLGNSVSSREHYGIYCDRGPTPVDGGTVPPNTILSNLMVGDRYYYDIVASTVLGGTGCALQLRASTIVGGKVGLFGICNQDFIASGEFVVGDGTPEGGNVFELQTTEDGDGEGVFAQCVRSVSASYNTFTNGNYGLNVVGSVGEDFSRTTRVQVDHNTFQRLSRYGLWVYGSGMIADVRDNSFTDISMRRFTTRPGTAYAMAISGDWTAPFPVVTARNNKFMNNDTGVYVQWSNPFLTAYTTPDFGRSDDPGNNVFHCNQLSIPLDTKWGGSVLLDFSDVPQPVAFFFEGNHWDHPQPSRSTAKGNVFENYADIMVTNANTLVRSEPSLSKVDGDCP